MPEKNDNSAKEAPATDEAFLTVFTNERGGGPKNSLFHCSSMLVLIRKVLYFFCNFWRTDRPTDRQTDRPTDLGIKALIAIA